MASKDKPGRHGKRRAKDPSIVPCQIRLIPLQLQSLNFQSDPKRAQHSETYPKDQKFNAEPTNQASLKPRKFARSPIKLDLGLKSKLKSTKNGVCIFF